MGVTEGWLGKRDEKKAYNCDRCFRLSLRIYGDLDIQIILGMHWLSGERNTRDLCRELCDKSRGRNGRRGACLVCY